MLLTKKIHGHHYYVYTKWIEKDQEMLSYWQGDRRRKLLKYREGAVSSSHSQADPCIVLLKIKLAERVRTVVRKRTSDSSRVRHELQHQAICMQFLNLKSDSGSATVMYFPEKSLSNTMPFLSVVGKKQLGEVFQSCYWVNPCHFPDWGTERFYLCTTLRVLLESNFLANLTY